MKHLGQTGMSDLLNYSSRTDILVCLIVYFELGNDIIWVKTTKYKKKRLPVLSGSLFIFSLQKYRVI
jgi:hypothetical protein